MHPATGSRSWRAVAGQSLSLGFQGHPRNLGHRGVLFLDGLAEFRGDAISSRLMRYRDGQGQDWADIIDMLTMHPEARRKVVRLLGEIEAAER
jgi:hypothetical protein